MKKKHYEELKIMVNDENETFGIPARMTSRIKDMRKRLRKGLKKIKELRKKGTPLKHIETNDWRTNLNPKIYISTPYPKHKIKTVWRAFR